MTYLVRASAIAALIATMMSPLDVYAQSMSGRTQGCFDASGQHHGPGWCAKHQK